MARPSVGPAQAVGHWPRGRLRPQKKQLPAFVLACRLRGGCRATNATAHTGYLIADVDHLGDRLEEVRENLKRDPHVAFGFISPSADGLKLGVKVSATIATHKAACDNVRTHLREVHGIELDSSGSDICRKCFVSHDPDLWINANAVELRCPADDGTEAASEDPADAASQDLTPTPSPSIIADHPPLSPASLERLAASCVPGEGGRNHDFLFRLARRLRGIESIDPAASKPEVIRLVFDYWYRLADVAGVLRQGESRDDYFAKFIDGHKRVKTPSGTSPIEQAWKRARVEPLPPEASAFETPEAHLLVSTCFQMDKAAGGQPWFLSTRTAGELIGKPHRQAGALLSCMVKLGILQVVQPGNSHRATRYRFVSRPPSST